MSPFPNHGPGHKHRNPFMRRRQILLATAHQFVFAVEGFDQLSLSPGSNELALALAKLGKEILHIDRLTD